MSEFLVPVALIALAALGIRTGTLTTLTRRPLVILLCAMVGGVVYQAMQLPPPPDGALAAGASFCLAMLGFLAAQQCRLSRLRALSAPAFRLAIGAPLLILILFSALAFVLMPGLGLSDVLLAGAAVMLGGAPAAETNLLNAPVADETKAAARLETASALSIAIPLAIILTSALEAPGPDQPFWATAMFSDMAGFGLGGLFGLLTGRLSLLRPEQRPVAPFAVGAVAYFGALLLGADPIMATVAAGITYAEGAPLIAVTRTRLWRTGEALITPFALIGFGFVIGPLASQASILILFICVLGVIVVRTLARTITLLGHTMPTQDREFLTWYNGAPGIGSALFLIYLLLGDTPGLSTSAAILTGATIIAGIAMARLTARSLTRRLVHQTAIARKRRYSPA